MSDKSVAKKAEKAAEEVKRKAKDLKEAAEKKAHEAVEEGKRRAEEIKAAAEKKAKGLRTKKAADDIKDEAEDALDDVKDMAKDAKDAAEDAMGDAKDKAEDAAEEVKDVAEDALEDGKDAVREVKKTAKDGKNKLAHEAEEALTDVEVNVIDDRDSEAESLIHWAAARAGVIVVTPGLGTLALMANEVYLITKLGAVYGVKLPYKAILSFIGSLGATVVGSTLATIIPIPGVSIPIGISVTYGVGKTAMRWIKDGMPDDTKPYQAVFEEERKEGSEKADELKENPDKDTPLGDEKRNFMQEIKKKLDDAYPEKAHAVVDDMAGSLMDTFHALGDKIVSALQKAGLTTEQIENAKYTAIGAAEVAQETAEKTAKDLRAMARIKSRELRKDAAGKAEILKARAKESMEELQKKGEEVKRQSDLTSEQVKVESEKLKAQARVHYEEAKVQAVKLKEQAKEQMEAARAKAEEISKLAKEKSKDYKEAGAAAASSAKENFRKAADEFLEKTDRRAARRKKEDEAEKGTDPEEE